MKLKIRVTLDITYETNGETTTDLLYMARRIAERASGAGMMTDSSAAEVDTWEQSVEVLQ